MLAIGHETSRLKSLVGIRGRLILLALILVTPLMMDWVRLLEENRATQANFARNELTALARDTAETQRHIITTVQAFLKSSAFVFSAADPDQGCSILSASKRMDLPWIRTLSAVDSNGRIECSTKPQIVGLDVHDREYFQRAMETSSFVISDYVFTRKLKMPAIVAAYPVTNALTGKRNILTAVIDLGWISKMLAERAERPGVTALLVGADGVVLAAPPGKTPSVGERLDASLLDAIRAKEIDLSSDKGSMVFDAGSGEKRAVTFARVQDTFARIIISTDEAQMLGDINENTSVAYAQFALVILVALLGAWIVAERLIVSPVQTMTDMAERFGSGDLTAQQPDAELPREFVPLRDAFNRMAQQLAKRERALIATNNRLSVMASVDMVSGLANRRGLQSRLNFEWMKAEQLGEDLSLVMIDIDYFKLFNDTYGHPEGDACLALVGRSMSAIAAQVSGFAARYGGEEFCVLLPGKPAAAALEVAETIRIAVQRLDIAHGNSTFQTVTVSAGVATMKPSGATSAQELIDAADAALYAAKRRGRNNVVPHALIRGDDSGLSIAS